MLWDIAKDVVRKAHTLILVGASVASGRRAEVLAPCTHQLLLLHLLLLHLLLLHLLLLHLLLLHLLLLHLPLLQ